MTEFAKQLKKYRTDGEITQDDLASKLFVTRQAISKWEFDESTPDLNNLVKLTEIFNVSLDSLVFGLTDQTKVDDEEFVMDPQTHTYVRRYGKMNFWDYMSKNWWVVLILGAVLIDVAMFIH
ncbi:helix-turn-helix domain-containing protein [Companilactobacillus huachuanensis]|uniref:Helix-turn-helix domain-containing protein n=1 Tax=Companilactobacillus huachuanensis TaxID=2559914 RepID=A0ABW1RLP8_9LACO|nr:helix-turn-helix transcriptional regulator [Companilactobacillus huachuanensis]